MEYHYKSALKKGSENQRLSKEEAYALAESITPDTVHAVGEAALKNRRHRCGPRATYVFNIQINPANICGAGCTFCNYAASKNASHAYVLSEEEIIEKVERLRPTEAHIVGGLNQVWPYDRNLGLVKELRSRFPELYIKAYTAVEIHYFAKTSKKTERQVLQEFIDAGLNAMPGGGAEIF